MVFTNEAIIIIMAVHRCDYHDYQKLPIPTISISCIPPESAFTDKNAQARPVPYTKGITDRCNTLPRVGTL